MKIKHQLLLTHGLLVILALSIVLINMGIYKGIESDAHIVNEAGKLRMLSYNMAMRINLLSNENTNFEPIMDRMIAFEAIIAELSSTDGESGVRIQDRKALHQLGEIQQKWVKILKPLYLQSMENPADGESKKKLNQYVEPFVDDINTMVTDYSDYADQKVTQAFSLNAGLVALLVALTLYSYVSTNKNIRKPMTVLMDELKTLSYLDDEVSSKIKDVHPDEFSEMNQYFNEMMFDQLTKVFTRKAGLSKLSRMVQFNEQMPKRLSLCFIDVNGLKEVNDHLGHRYGDELIVSAIASIQHEIRSEDFIIRMGGDEFLIVFKDVGDDAAEKIWHRINQHYEVINTTEDRPYLISVSHGVVEYSQFEKTQIDVMIKHADDKMYAEKKFIKDELKLKVVRKTLLEPV